MSKTTKTPTDVFEVGQLLQLKSKYGFVKLHPHFNHPATIWEPLKIFWETKHNVRLWGVEVAGTPRPSSVPEDAFEWVTPIRMECAWDLGAEGIHQRDIARQVLLNSGAMLVVMEAIVTPWKKRYKFAGGGQQRQRFSYVKFLATYEDKAVYLYHDVSHMHGTVSTVGIDSDLFDLMS